MMTSGDAKAGQLPVDIRATVVDAVTRDDRDGAKIVNGYKIAKRLGEGAYGFVKEGEDLSDGTKVAIKVYHKHALLGKKEFSNFAPDGTMLERMRVSTAFDKVVQEIALLQTLNHPSCVRLREVMEVTDASGKFGKLYLVMDLAKFGSLMDAKESPSRFEVAQHLRRRLAASEDEVPLVVRRRIRRPPPPAAESDSDDSASEADLCGSGADSLDELASESAAGDPEAHAEWLTVWTFDEEIVKHFVKDVAGALNYLHSADCRVIHRDVKPDNLLLCSDGRVKLGDFGVAAKGDDQFRVRRTEGTYHFMPPECFGPEPAPAEGLDGRVGDLWALGVTVWAMLCGTLPFDGNSLDDLFNTIYEANLRFPEFDTSDDPSGNSLPFSDEAVGLLRQMLDKDAARRLSAADVLEHSWVKSASPLVHAKLVQRLAA